MYGNFCSTFAYILVKVFSDFGGIAKGKAASEIYPLTSLKIHLRLYFDHWNTRNYTEARGDVSIRQLRQQDISILRVSVLIRACQWLHILPLPFLPKNRIFQTFLTKNLLFALFICQFGFFFVPLHAFGVQYNSLGNCVAQKGTFLCYIFYHYHEN